MPVQEITFNDARKASFRTVLRFSAALRLFSANCSVLRILLCTAIRRNARITERKLIGVSHFRVPFVCSNTVCQNADRAARPKIASFSCRRHSGLEGSGIFRDHVRSLREARLLGVVIVVVVTSLCSWTAESRRTAPFSQRRRRMLGKVAAHRRYTRPHLE